jgi:hypothetical protein
MKRFVPALSLLCFVCFVTSALACLGDTEEELVKRYGPQKKTGTTKIPGMTIRGFVFGKYMVIVGVLNGHSVTEMYTKMDQSKISPTDLTALMNANAGGKTWAVDDTAKGPIARWVLEDGTIVAEWNKASGAPLTVMTKEAADMEIVPAKKK